MNLEDISHVRGLIKNEYWHDLARFLNNYKSNIALTMIFVACRDTDTIASVQTVISKLALECLIENLPTYSD